MTEKKHMADKQVKAYNDFFDVFIKNAIEAKDPVMVATTMLGQALRILRTEMPKEDFNKFVESFNETKDKIKPFDVPTNVNKTLH